MLKYFEPSLTTIKKPKQTIMSSSKKNRAPVPMSGSKVQRVTKGANQDKFTYNPVFQSLNQKTAHKRRVGEGLCRPQSPPHGLQLNIF